LVSQQMAGEVVRPERDEATIRQPSAAFELLGGGINSSYKPNQPRKDCSSSSASTLTN
jgi:hypothetical protein